MLLAIDVGNTEIVIGVFDGAELTQHWRVATVESRTADEHALLLGGFLGHEGLGFETVRGMVVSSVVPRLSQTMRELAARYIGADPIMIEPGIRTGVPILTDNPREVGADRVVNAVAAIDAYGGPAIVVDFGTATTFDTISEKGELLGTAIAPGIQISVSALAERTAQLRRVELVAPRSAIGRNTVASLQAGIVFGFAAQVDGIVRRIKAELGDHATVIATGGLAEVVLGVCETLQHYDPWLTLRGLRLVYELNTTETGAAHERRQPEPRRAAP